MEGNKQKLSEYRRVGGLVNYDLKMLSFRFSANILMSLCHRIDAQPLAGMIVIGDGQAARAVALAGNSMKIPVLWAKGGTANLQDGNREVSEP